MNYSPCETLNLTIYAEEESGLETQENTLLCCMRLGFVKHLPLGFLEEDFKTHIINQKTHNGI